MSTSSDFNKLSSLFSGNTSKSSTPTGWSAGNAFGNSSWEAGSSSTNKVHSYVNVLKAPKKGTGATSKAVQRKFGITNLDAAGKAAAAKSGHHSLLGSILGGIADVSGNLVQDTIDTGENFFPGILKLATTNPIDSAKTIAKGYEQNYGKLFSGDIGGFAHDVAKHPLGYLLDASTLGTGGGAILGRLVPKFAETGSVALRVDRAAVKSGEAVGVSKNLSRNVWTRNVFEKPGYALQRILPENTPFIGESRAAVKQATGALESSLGAVQHSQHVFEKTVRDLRHTNQKDDSLLHAIDQVSNDIRSRPQQAGIHMDKGIPAFLTPTSRALDPRRDFNLNETVQSSDKITHLVNTIKSEIQFAADGTIVAKDGASAAAQSFLKLHNAKTSLTQAVDTATMKSQEVLKTSPNSVATKMTKSGQLVKKDRGAKASKDSVRIAPDTVETIPAHRVDSPSVFSHFDKNGKQVWTKGSSKWVPETSVTTKGSALYSKGAEHLAPAELNRTGVPSVNAGKMVTAAANKALPTAKTYLNGIRVVDTHSDPVANYLEMHSHALGALGKDIAKGFLDKYGENPGLVRELSSLYEKKSPPGSLTGQYNKATQIWKDIILVGRPAFLVNNFVGNQVMYHLKNGIAGKAFQMAATGKLDKTFDKHFFEHRTSLGESEKAVARDPLAPENKYRRNVNRVYNIQGKHEQVLRKATMREVALTIPAIKNTMREFTSAGMDESTAFGKAMDKALASTDGASYRELISKGIDDTMGNYRHYSAFEKQIKAVVPFYGWNRHALRTYSSILKDQPGRANVIAEASRMGAGENAKNFPGTPDFMHSYVTGKFGTYDTSPLNPLKGGTDTIKAIKEIISNKPGHYPTIAGNLNPIIGAAAQALSGVNLATGAPIKQSRIPFIGGALGGLAGSTSDQIFSGMPLTKMGSLALGMDKGGNRNDPKYFLTPTGMLKKKFVDSEGKVKMGPDGLPMESADRHMLQPSLKNSFLSYVGIPKRDVNLKTAQTVAKSIATKEHGPGEFHNRSKQKAKVKAIMVHTPKPAKSSANPFA